MSGDIVSAGWFSTCPCGTDVWLEAEGPLVRARPSVQVVCPGCNGSAWLNWTDPDEPNGAEG